MAIGVNWSEIWKPVWKPVWTQDGAPPVGVPPVVLTDSLPTAYNAVPYSVQLEASGDGPITWTLESGDLPNGMSLSSAGVISGICSTEDLFEFTVRATNSEGYDDQVLSILVDEAVEASGTGVHVMRRRRR